MTQLVAGLIYLGILLTPGWLLARLLFPGHHKFLLSYSLSLLILAATLVITSAAEYYPVSWLKLVGGAVVILITINIFFNSHQKTSNTKKEINIETLGVRGQKLGGLFRMISKFLLMSCKNFLLSITINIITYKYFLR